MSDDLLPWADPDRDGVVFRLPRNVQPTNAAPCKGCRRLIAWCLTEAGKKAPYDAAGTSHFATCPKADRFRKDKTPEEPEMPPFFTGIDL